MRFWMPTRTSSAFITGDISILALRGWKRGSAMLGIWDGSRRSKTMYARFAARPRR
jgi:hypothetical protein